jgi:hypothetical protein
MTIPHQVMSSESFLKALREMAVTAPDGQIDSSIQPMIAKFDEVPKALQILEVLDHCARCALASGVAMRALNAMLAAAIPFEETTYAEVEAIANQTWRKQFEGETVFKPMPDYI